MNRLLRAASVVGVISALVFGATSCDVLSPPPTEPESKTIALDDARLLVITDLALVCEERMEQMAYLLPCTMKVGAQGREAHCSLKPPFDSLMFGCGPDEEQPAERLRLRLVDGRQANAFRAALEVSFGVCPGMGGGDTVSEGAPRHDEGRCYLPRGVHGSPLASAPRSFAEGRVMFPMGLSMELGSVACVAGDSEPLADEPYVGEGTAEAVDLALIMETELLTANERAAVVQQIETILSLSMAAE